MTTGPRPRPLATLLASLALLLAPAPARGQDVALGVARVDITPDGPIRLSGYRARDRESAGVERPLWAKALAIGSDPQGPALLVAVDNLGVPEALTAELAARLKRRAGISRDRLAVGSSHTHSAPCLAGTLPNLFGGRIPADQQGRIDRYTLGLLDKLEAVCLAALADRKPGKLAWAVGEVGFAANRRTPGGPVDRTLPVLKVTAPDGTLRAVVANYACHCTTLDPALNKVCGDWAGYAQEAIEADHPGSIALTLIGCGADSNPSPRGPTATAVAHGRALADELNRLLRGPWADLPGPPSTSLERLALPFDTLPTRAALEALVKAGGDPGSNAKTQLARLDRGEPLQAELPYSVQAWRFGDALAMVFLPGEVVVDYALRLKREFDPVRLWVTAYANDVPCYIPSERILKEGGYEGGGAMVYYGLPTRLKPGVEQLILDASHRAVGPGFAPRSEFPPPLDPEASRQAFRMKPGLKIELVASEPLIQSPVAIDFGADGKLWVCEMRDYPMGIDGNWKAGGVIRVLEDRDGDGRYETGTNFLEGLPFPTGVTAWGKGALICAAPDILYAEDTDGDGKADVRRTLFEGFATENYQARVNGLALGLDGWVYGANGLIGGAIRGTASGKTIDIGGRDFRMKPDTGEFEPASGLTQQGRVRDDWGNPFGGENEVIIQHYPLPDHASRRNPRVAPPAPAVLLAGDPDASRVFAASRGIATFHNPATADRVTSACSPLIYRDTLLGPAYAGNAFACEPVHNLVTRLVLEPDGVTFAGHRAPDERASEFLASTDPWSRPVQVRTGPDGALWVVDMYRSVIEHPRWIRPERLAVLDVRAGADRGRIYRIYPDDQPPRPVPRLDALATPALVAALDDPSGTLRDTVHRLLVARADRSATDPLVTLVTQSSRPEVRAQALAILDGLGTLGESTLRAGLADAHPGVRGEAARMAAPRAAAKPDGDLARDLFARADDPEMAVRFRVALGLGDIPGPEAAGALGRIAVRDGADTWARAAVLSSATRHAAALLEQVIAAAGSEAPPAALVEPLIATAAGDNKGRDLARVLAAIVGPPGSPPAPWRLGALAAYLDASPTSAHSVRPVLASARLLAADAAAPAADRVTALRLLGRDRGALDADRAAVAGRLDPAEPPEVQVAAVRTLARMGDPASVDAILAHWAGFGPATRGGALDALLARAEPADALVAALEGGRIEAGQVDAAHREALRTQGPVARRDRAGKVFGASSNRPRQAVLDAFAAARTLPGDAGRGRAVFERACASCHRLGPLGHEVGPDLAALTDKTPEALLTAILDPNREVDARYASYAAALKDGRVLTGLIAAETASAITLKRQDGQSDTILRADLDELTTAGRSLMPEGLENDVKVAELADLLAFLAHPPATP